jgi:hypothetical protein
MFLLSLLSLPLNRNPSNNNRQLPISCFNYFSNNKQFHHHHHLHLILL